MQTAGRQARGHPLEKNRKRDRKPRFLQLLQILIIYILMFAVVLSVGRNVLYSVGNNTVSILESSDFTGPVVPEKAGTLLVWEKKDGTGAEGRREMKAILTQMRIPYTEIAAEDFSEADLSGKEIVVLAATNLNALGGRLTKLLNWEKGIPFFFYILPLMRRLSYRSQESWELPESEMNSSRSRESIFPDNLCRELKETSRSWMPTGHP